MSVIIDAKLHRPAAVGLVRRRLYAPLQEETGPGVVTVLAPPGSGKTTLLALAAAQRRTAWCTAGPEDRSGPGFLGHLARSLSRSLGVDVGQPESAAALVGAVSELGQGSVLLVIDDIHELAGGPAERQLAELIRWRPAGLRIALGTRRPLAVNTERLLLSGELTELDAEALRFRSWEVEELFRVVYDQPLSPEAAASLTRRTGGWAAGLKLFQLATAGKSRDERERAVVELGGRSRLLRSYLTRTVLEELDSARRDFLLRTSTLGILTGPLCDELLGARGSAGILDELASQQFFISAAEDGTSYRYHQVMQTLLEGLLVDEYGAVRTREVYAASARILEAAGLLGNAARAYALAEDHASVAQLVQHAGADLVLGPLNTSDFPDDDPWLALARGRRLHRMGALAESAATFRQAETLLDDADFRHRCAEERAGVTIWLPDGARDRPPSARRPSPTVAEVVRQATVQLTPRLGDQLPPLAGGLRLLLSGDLAGARSLLRRVVHPSVPERLVIDLAVVVTDLADRSAGDVVSRLEQVVLAADLENQPWLARMGRGLQACVLLADGVEEWRLESCASLVEECQRGGDQWGAVLLMGSLGTALAVRGDARSDAWLVRAAVAAARLEAEVLRAWAETLAAFAAATRGERDAGARLASAHTRARWCGLYDAEAVVRGLLAHAQPRAAGGTEPCKPRLRLRCLGAFTIEADGAPVQLPPMRPLPRDLLLQLAMRHGQEVHREVLMDRLWPGVPVEAATHRLHAAASSVRKTLSVAGLTDALLSRQADAYRLVLGDATFDVSEFECALQEAARSEARGNLHEAFTWNRRATELYAGDLLPGAGPSEWVVEERERLRVAAAAAAYAVASLALRLGHLAEALPPAHRAVELDPLRDSAWSLLVEIQTRMGDLSAAAATRRVHGRVVRELTPAAPRPGGQHVRA